MESRGLSIDVLVAVLGVTFFISGNSTALAEPRLTLEQLMNAEYQSEFSESGKVKLRNGRYEEKLDSDSETTIRFWLSDKIAFGDLNNDGLDDAAVVLVSSGGGSGTFYELVAVINQNGVPRQAAVKTLGDRVDVRALSIRSGRIVAEMTKHGPGDPMCCPSLRVTNKFKLKGNDLEIDR